MNYQTAKPRKGNHLIGFISAKKILAAGCFAAMAFSGNASASFTSCVGPNSTLPTTTYDISKRVTTAANCAILNPLNGKVNDDVSPPASTFTVNTEQFFGSNNWLFDGKFLESGSAIDFFNFSGNNTSGSYTFNGSPTVYDYMFVFKDGNGTNLVGYLLTVTGGLNGNYSNPFTDPPFSFNGNSVVHDISHISVYYRDSNGGTTVEVPEPGSTAIFGLGLLGMGLISLRGKKKQP